ncbi:MAG: hypothetical protein AAF417_16600 [Pseudomonadota bacterium]
MRRAVSSLMLGWIAMGGAAFADDEALPDLDFLEYLGSWEESDEEWLLFEDDGDDEATVDEERESDSEAEKRKVAGVEE